MVTSTRRTVIGTGVVLLSSLAGCSTSGTERRTATGSSDPDAQNLDLREANVTEVRVD